MTTIFVAYTQEDAQCAEQMRKGFELQGYAAWREPSTLNPSSPTYPRIIETAIMGSGALILVWSASAAMSQWLQRSIAFAQRLQKQIVPVVIDGTGLPPTLLSVEQITSLPPYTDAVSQLVPLLPTPNSKDALLLLCEQAASSSIGKRKDAIDAATSMLQQDEQREALLALLDYLAHNDLMAGVRESAQDALAAVQKQVAQLPPDIKAAQTHNISPITVQKQAAQLPSDMDPQHSIGFLCRNCGHVNYFDKRVICKTVEGELVRGGSKASNEKELDELTGYACKQCGEAMTLYIDCEGYK
jgi:RNase P subunit RPR2